MAMTTPMTALAAKPAAPGAADRIDTMPSAFREVPWIEVEAKQEEGAGLVGQAHKPRRSRLRRTNTVGAGVAVLVEAAVGVAFHHADVLARADATRELPGCPSFGRHAGSFCARKWR